EVRRAVCEVPGVGRGPGRVLPPGLAKIEDGSAAGPQYTGDLFDYAHLVLDKAQRDRRIDKVQALVRKVQRRRVVEVNLGRAELRDALGRHEVERLGDGGEIVRAPHGALALEVDP